MTPTRRAFFFSVPRWFSSSLRKPSAGVASVLFFLSDAALSSYFFLSSFLRKRRIACQRKERKKKTQTKDARAVASAKDRSGPLPHGRGVTKERGPHTRKKKKQSQERRENVGMATTTDDENPPVGGVQ